MFNNLLILLLLVLILIILYYNSFNNNILTNNNSFNILNYHNLLEFLDLLNNKNVNKLIDYSTKVPTYLKPRNHIPIANKYIIIKKDDDYSDYHFVLYWINKNEFTVIIRRLDNYKIINPFKLKIYDINNLNYEIIDFEPIDNNVIIENIKCKIELIKTITENEQIIPKIIIQTGKSNECNLAQYNSIMSFIELNPEYEYMYFDDNDCYNYIKNNYDEYVLNAYNKLKPTAYKADLFRVCVLYKLGGCYFDNKQINRIPLREIINYDQNLILCQDTKQKALYNAFMICSPNNLTIKKVIDAIILNIENKYYGTCPLCPTGQCLLYKIDPTHKTDIINRFNHIVYSYHKIRHKGNIYSKKIKKIIINTSYKDYYKKDNKSYYSNLWHNKDIYN